MEINEWKEVITKMSNFGKIFSVDSKNNQLSDNEFGQFYNLLKRLDTIAKVTRDSWLFFLFKNILNREHQKKMFKCLLMQNKHIFNGQ